MKKIGGIKDMTFLLVVVKLMKSTNIYMIIVKILEKMWNIIFDIIKLYFIIDCKINLKNKKFVKNVKLLKNLIKKNYKYYIF